MSNILTRKEMKDLFLNITANTVPSGKEHIFIDNHLLPYLANLELEHSVDRMGNIWVKIGESRTLFAAHLDDVSPSAQPVNHVITNNRWIATDGKTILGADNKAGVLVLFALMTNKVQGNYAFFVGEEIGCQGSGAVAEEHKGLYDRVISFDRKSYGSIITHQSYGRTCSDQFAETLSDLLAKEDSFFEKDGGGIYTDSNSFAPYVPECTNLSVGMFHCHSHSEHLDMYYLAHTINALVVIDWEALPSVRDMSLSNRRRLDDFGYTGFPPEKRVPRYGAIKNIWELDDYAANPAEDFLDYGIEDNSVADRCPCCNAVLDVPYGSYCSECLFDFGCDRCNDKNADFLVLTEDGDLFCGECAVAVDVDPASDFFILERKV